MASMSMAHTRQLTRAPYRRWLLQAASAIHEAMINVAVDDVGVHMQASGVSDRVLVSRHMLYACDFVAVIYGMPVA